MKNARWNLAMALWFGLVTTPVVAGPLWEIGRADRNDAEFALAPNGYSQYRDDGFYVVGRSNPKEAWPYVHPGPADNWAGNRAHTFTIIFGVKDAVATGTCRLAFDLVDTHYGHPPKLKIFVNGQKFAQQTPVGASDESIFGNPGKGKPFQFEVEFPVALLKAGANQIDVTNDDGSWILYDRIALETPPAIVAAPTPNITRVGSVQPEPVLVEREGKLFQPVVVSVTHLGEPAEASVGFSNRQAEKIQLKNGTQRIEALAPAVEKATEVSLTLVADGKTLVNQPVTLTPVRKWEIYILMHSHVDIGYTDIQPNIAKKQVYNITRALELIRANKDLPVGAKFKWNLEVFWPAFEFYKVATPEQKKEFEQAVRDGWIGVDAMFGNLLTGVCRSEELLRQFSFATDFGRRCGVTVDSMQISDVPGLTWGVVSALAQAGVKYVSDGPNYADRIGWTRVTWEDKPFWWVGPDGKSKVLYWAPYFGYAFGHTIDKLPEAVLKNLHQLEENSYPYDIVQMRWSKGDNGSADERVIQQVKDWNEKYAYPKLIIATTSEMFHAFEKRYGDKLPTFRGDFTPYWEDGVGSAARETALNRLSADRLAQTETLWALLNPDKFPAAEFDAAWQNCALWSEHTWGAHNSIHQPDIEFVKTQWKYKQAFALDADKQSRDLFLKVVGGPRSVVADAVDVFNTASWPRTDLVTLPKETKGDQVKDERGEIVPSQRLSTGELAFLATDVPPFGGKRFTIVPGPATATGNAKAAGTTVSSPAVAVRLDAATGAIASLRGQGIDAELVDGQLNSYVYLPGGNVNDAKANDPAEISVKETGPLVASLLVESGAPGCRKLVREIRVVDGLDRVEIINQVDKLPVRTVEGVHFGFEFKVPDAKVRMNSAWAVAQPEVEQIPGACKNWFSVERWVDVSNPQYGVTWATVDAPLVEMGGLTANLPRGQPNPKAYLTKIEPSPKLYSWAMNNHWHTNYKADQDGWTTFRYAIRPHRAYDALAAARFGVESSEQLIVRPASSPEPVPSRLRVEPDDVLVTAFKPSDDGKAWIIRLFGASGKDEQVRLNWSKPTPKVVTYSNASELAGAPAPVAIPVKAWEIVTLRAELP